MTSRERVLRVFEHREPDRVPVDFSGHRSSGIAALAYAKLRDSLGLPKRPIRVYDSIQQLAVVDADVRRRFKVDTIEIGRGFARSDEDWRDWTLPGGIACRLPAWVTVERGVRHPGEVLASGGGFVFQQMHNILANVPPANILAMFESVNDAIDERA